MALILEDDVSVSPLTTEEKAWAKKLDALLGKMPERLKLVEVDDSLVLVDRGAVEATSESGIGAVRGAGGVLATLTNGVLKITGMTH
jgi:hypothetical protein